MLARGAMNVDEAAGANRPIEQHGSIVRILTKSIETPDAFREALLLPKGILVEPMICEPVHEGR